MTAAERSRINSGERIFRGGCFSGTEALANASSCDFDIFVIDYDIPGMNGLELARELRRQGHGAPIVMLSGRLEPPNEPGAELLTRFISKGDAAEDFETLVASTRAWVETNQTTALAAQVVLVAKR